MPVKQAAFKDLRQSHARALRNKKVVSDVTALIRRIRKVVAGKDQNKATELLRQVIKKIDKAVQKGVIKKNTAARKKPRLTKVINNLIKKSYPLIKLLITLVNSDF